MASTATKTARNLFPNSRRKMSIGISLPMAEKSAFGGTPRWSDFREMAALTEAIGLDGVSIVDHYVYRSADPSTIRGFWEAGTIATALAATTNTIQVSIMVAGSQFRHPVHVVKMAETISEVGGGRFILGLAAGANRPDFDMAGIPFSYRSSRFEEALSIVYPLLKEGHVDHHGKHYEANDAYNVPRSLAEPAGGVPLVIGTKGERMRKLTAQLADGWYSGWQVSPETLTPQMDALDAACDEIGRNPLTLSRLTGTHVAMTGCLGFRPNPLTGAPEEIAEKIRGFREAGANHFLVSLDPCTPAAIEEFARVVEFLDRDEGI